MDQPIAAGLGRDDKGLGIVEALMGEAPLRVGDLQQHRGSLHQAHDVARAIGGGFHHSVELEAVHVVEVIGVGGQMHQLPVGAGSNDCGAGDQLLAHPRALAAEVQIGEGAVDVDGPGLAVQVQAHPVIHLKGEDIGCRADLEDHDILAGTMHRAVGDEEKRVFVCGEMLDKLLHLDGLGGGLAGFQRGAEGVRIDPGLKAKVDLRAGPRVQDVIGLILGEAFAELAADVGWGGVTLHREIAAVEGVQEVEADGEFCAEDVGAAPQHCGRAVEHEQVEGGFQEQAVAFQEQTIFRDDQLEGPGVVDGVLGQLGDVGFEPLPTPCAGFEPGAHAEIGAAHGAERGAQGVTRGPDRFGGALPVHDPVEAGQEVGLVPVERDPINKVEALVHGLVGRGGRHAQVGDGPGAGAELDFVLGQVNVHQRALPTA